ncbi:hypothetical protein AUC69_02775 [Methyloceanibacter superfactus]|uniref:Uncharacterized protein n=1 Tax=Methyloceanibacter superfactus TaxID=1774969 RepID=A0A1E3VPH3_9HYPH|nr:hypothetical protein AUC69_02775 [Methyloceanibacter superfactus]
MARALQREPKRLGNRRYDDRVAQHAVVELHRERVLEQVEIPGRGLAEPARDEGPIDQRPSVETETAVDPGHHGAREQLQIDESEHGGGDE